MKIMKFSAKWCGPCRMFAPIFDEWTGTLNNIEVESLDVDKDFDKASEYHVRNIPMLIAVKDGKVHRLQGLKKESELQEWFESIN